MDSWPDRSDSRQDEPAIPLEHPDQAGPAVRDEQGELLDRMARMAGFFGHDFNNLLSIIKLNCDRLAREVDGDLHLLRLVEMIRSTAARGSALTRSLMTLTHHRHEPDQVVALDPLVRENAAFLATMVGARVRLKLDLQATGCAVRLSPAALLNALINLVINAHDAMPDGGTITLASAGSDREVVLTVADTGPGMDPATLARTQQPLFSTKPHGTGLGLASVRDFMATAGGEMRIESHPGAGTRVRLVFRCLAPACSGRTMAAPSSEQQGRGAPVRSRLLVVEDEPFALEALCELLANHGLDVCGCSSMGAALAELATGAYGVLLTDVELTDGSGAELARAGLALDPGLRVIVMSGYAAPADTVDGSWLFVRKPLNSAAVAALARTAARSRAAALN